MPPTYHVYIITNWDSSIMYIGVTNNLARRMHEHKNKIGDGFSSKYNLDKLVYYEDTPDVSAAITREKQLKGWRREKKNELVATTNPEWKDLSDGMQ